MIRGISALLIAVLFIGCNEPTVLLRYEFEPQEETNYLWSITATSVLDAPSGITRRRISADVEVHQLVEAVEQDRSASLRTTLSMVKLEVDGSPVPAEPPFTIVITATSSGRVSGIETLALPAGASAELDIDRLMAEYLPPLPITPVEIGEQWSAPLRTEGSRSLIALIGHGRLVGFALEDRKRLAHVRIDRSGDIETSQQVARTEVQLTGTTRITSDSMIDIDSGSVHSWKTRSMSEFRVSLGAGTGAGSLRIEVTSELRAR